MSEPLRVLQILRYLDVGGAETLVVNLHCHIDRSKVQFDYLLFWPEKTYYEEEIRRLGGRIYRLPYMTDIGFVRWQKVVKQFFESHPEYSIVHSHMNTISGPILKMAKRAGVPCRIAHSHNTNLHYPFPDCLVKAIFKLGITRSATDLMACSADAASWLFGKVDNNRIMTLLKNGIDLDRFHYVPDTALRNELGFEGRYVIGHVGGFREQKNQIFLINLMPMVLKRQPKAMLVLVGDGPMRDQAEQRVKELGLTEVVHFLGVRSDIPELMSLFDVFAFPSLWEGLGIVLIEAQATGLKCVVSDGLPAEADMGVDLVDFVTLDDPRAWAEHLIVSGEGRSDTHVRIAENGYDVAQTALWLENWYLAMSDPNKQRSREGV